MRKTEVRTNKHIYLGQAILDISKTLMYEFWYDYIKPKYSDKARLGYMDRDSFFMHIKREDFYKDIACDVERWFDTSNYDENDKRPLPIGENKKVIAMFKDELGSKIMSVIIEVQNEVDVINEVKQKASEIDIDTLKSIHNTLASILRKWRDIILEMINRDNACM